MERAKLDELHYITALANLQSIAERGILCHSLASRHPHVDLSSEDVQKLRQGKQVAFAGQAKPRKLHSYVNVFLHARNSMLKAVCHDHGHLSVVVLRVSSDSLDLPGAVIADQNAASRYARFWASPGGLLHLEEDQVFARTWGDQTVDQIDYWRRKSRRSAELLVPERIAPELVEGIYVSCAESSERCESLGLSVPIVLDEDLFFL